MNMREFGVRLTQFRKREKLSITELATRLGIDYMQVSRYEKGQTFPSLDSAIRLSIVFKVSLDELLMRNTPPEPPVFQNKRLFDRMRDLDRLPQDRQELALRILDTVISGYELEDLSRRLARS